jgi:hypothetical protein
MTFGVNFGRRRGGARQYRMVPKLNEVCSLFPLPLTVFAVREDLFDIQYLGAKADVGVRSITIVRDIENGLVSDQISVMELRFHFRLGAGAVCGGHGNQQIAVNL